VTGGSNRRGWITNNRILNFDRTTFHPNGIHIQHGAEIRVSENHISGAANGIYLQTSNVSNVDVLSNKLDLESSPGFEDHLPQGILLAEGGGSGSPSNVNIIGNSIVGGGFAIRIERASQIRVLDNTARESVNEGLWSALSVVESTNCEIARNRTVNNRCKGIAVVASANTILRGNTSNGNDGVGILLEDSIPGSRSIVEGNTANGNKGDGMVLSAGAGSIVQGNTANENKRHGIALSGAGVTAHGNTALDNLIFDLFDTGIPACANNWKGNTFRTDNEAGANFGPETGCIR
jgi:parallel beta-helix repeat protein